MTRDTSNDGDDWKKKLLSSNRPLWLWLQSDSAGLVRRNIERLINASAINDAIFSMPERPNPLSTGWSYTTWEGLSNRRWSKRHLPPVSQEGLPKPEVVARNLFQRTSGEMIPSKKSTLTFAFFAQWFTDGFLVADQVDRRRNYSNHEIDLCQLYGLNPETTNLIRTKQHGLLKSQEIDDAEFPPFLLKSGEPHWEFNDGFQEKRDLSHYDHFNSIGEHALRVKRGQKLTNDNTPTLDYHDAQGNPVPPPYMGMNQIPLSIPDIPQKLRDKLDLPDPKKHWKSWFAMANDRANSTPAYVMMNVLMLREHNRIAKELKDEYYVEWDAEGDAVAFDERIFQTTRNILIVILLKIVIEEYINHISRYNFRLKVAPDGFFPKKSLGAKLFPKVTKNTKMPAWKSMNWMTVEFNLLYRWHSMIPENIEFGGIDHRMVDTLWDNNLIIDKGLGPLFEGISKQPAGEISAKNTSEFLVEMAEIPAIQMARDMELDSFNAYRKNCGLPPFTKWEQFSGDSDIQNALKELYGEIDRVEFIAGIFSEEPRKNSALASLLGLMVGIDAFSQALNNPLLQRHTFNETTFSPYGWETYITKPQSLEELVNRNTPEAKERTFKVHMTRAEWTRS